MSTTDDTPSKIPVVDADLPPVDKDLAEQANPGHGIPSQDPDPAAQVLLTPEERARESKAAFMGGGTMVGAAAGAAVGAAVAGPVGIVVGGIVGGVTGAGGAAAVGAAVEPASKDDTTAPPVRPDANDSGNPT